MDWNERLNNWSKAGSIVPREEKIQETVFTSRQAFFTEEWETALSPLQFLWGQLQMTRKRWWFFQALLLGAGCVFLPQMEDHFLKLRGLGVIGCLFTVVMIPELWRNRESGSMQVEAACLYSLHRVYAARMTLFALVDILLLTFSSISLGCMGFHFIEVISQLLLPAAVTACICLWLLCRQNIGEAASLMVSLTWSAGWWLIVMNEQLYSLIAPGVWAGLFVLALFLLALAARRVLLSTNQCWEVPYHGIEAD